MSANHTVLSLVGFQFVSDCCMSCAVFNLQDMRVQAFKCSQGKSNRSAPTAAATQPASPAVKPPHHTEHAQPENPQSSSSWSARTAALTSSSGQPFANGSAQHASANAPDLPNSNIFSAQPTTQQGTNTDPQPAPANPQPTHGVGVAETGVLVGSSAMADSHCGVVIALALCGGLVCSAGGDAMIKVWRADTLQFVRYAPHSTSC